MRRRLDRGSTHRHHQRAGVAARRTGKMVRPAQRGESQRRLARLQEYQRELQAVARRSVWPRDTVGEVAPAEASQPPHHRGDGAAAHGNRHRPRHHASAQQADEGVPPAPALRPGRGEAIAGICRHRAAARIETLGSDPAWLGGTSGAGLPLPACVARDKAKSNATIAGSEMPAAPRRRVVAELALFMTGPCFVVDASSAFRLLLLIRLLHSPSDRESAKRNKKPAHRCSAALSVSRRSLS